MKSQFSKSGHPVWAVGISSMLSIFLSGCFPFAAGGLVLGSVAIVDPRTIGTQLEDKTIGMKAAQRIANLGVPSMHVNVVSYNRKILLTGEVPSRAVKADIEWQMKTIPNGIAVYNALMVQPVSSLSDRTHDTWITTRIKARLLQLPHGTAAQIKVVTEAGAVYLLGIIRRRDADAITQIARTTEGVQKVVTAYLDYVD